MTREEWDDHLASVADSTKFILGDRFEEEDGQALARILATAGWPNHSTDRVYAKAGDNSNRALRHLQRKYHAALEILAVAQVHALTEENS